MKPYSCPLCKSIMLPLLSGRCPMCDVKIVTTQLEGYLVRYTDGMTGFVYSDPMHWPLSIINKIMCVHKMPKPVDTSLERSKALLSQVEVSPMKTN